MNRKVTLIAFFVFLCPIFLIGCDSAGSNGSNDDGGDNGTNNSNRILYLEGNQGVNTFNLYTIRPDGSDRTQVTEGDENRVFLGRWADEKSKIVFVESGVNETDIYKINPDGTGKESVLDIESREDIPEPSSVDASSNKIAFAPEDDSHYFSDFRRP